MLENMVQVFLLGNRKYPNYEESIAMSFLGFITGNIRIQAYRILYLK